MRKCAKRRDQNTVEFEHGALIKNDSVEIIRLDASMVETIFDRRHRKGGIVFAARKSLFLDDGDWHAVDDKRGRRVMIVRRHTEDFHLNIDSRARGRVPRELVASLEAPAAPRAWRAARKGGAA